MIAYRLGVQLESQSFIKYLGEANYKKLVNFLLIKIAEIDDIPVKRYVVNLSQAKESLDRILVR